MSTWNTSRTEVEGMLNMQHLRDVHESMRELDIAYNNIAQRVVENHIADHFTPGTSWYLMSDQTPLFNTNQGAPLTQQPQVIHSEIDEELQAMQGPLYTWHGTYGNIA